MLRRYSITSYGERENRYEEVAEYFRAHFAQVHKRKGVQKQELYIVRLRFLHWCFCMNMFVTAFYIYAREFLELSLCSRSDVSVIWQDIRATQRILVDSKSRLFYWQSLGEPNVFLS